MELKVSQEPGLGGCGDLHMVSGDSRAGPGPWCLGKTSGIVEGKLKTREEQRPPRGRAGVLSHHPENTSGLQELCRSMAPWLASPHCAQSFSSPWGIPFEPY